MENKFTEELTELAKENGVELSEDEAQDHFDRQNSSGELSDDELDGVAGGVQGRTGNFNNVKFYSDDHCCDNYECRICGSRYLQHYCDFRGLMVMKACRNCKYATKRSNEMYICNLDLQ